MLLNDLSQLHDIHLNATDKEQKESRRPNG